MKQLLEYGNEYARRSDWRDFALVKVCLCALGFILGLSAPRRWKKPALFLAVAAFVATGLPLMKKFLGIMTEAPAEQD